MKGQLEMLRKFFISPNRCLTLLVKLGRIAADTPFPPASVMTVRQMANGVGFSYPKGAWGRGISTIISWATVAREWEAEENQKALEIDVEPSADGTYLVSSRSKPEQSYLVDLGKAGNRDSCPCSKARMMKNLLSEGGWLQGAWKRHCSHQKMAECHHQVAAYVAAENIRQQVISQMEIERKECASLAQFYDRLEWRLLWEKREGIPPEASTVPVLWGVLKAFDRKLAVESFNRLPKDLRDFANSQSAVFKQRYAREIYLSQREREAWLAMPPEEKEGFSEPKTQIDNIIWGLWIQGIRSQVVATYNAW